MKKGKIFLIFSSVLAASQIWAAPNNQIGEVSFVLTPGAATEQLPEVSSPSSPYTITCVETALDADQGYVYMQVSPTDTAQLDATNPQHQFQNIMPTKKSDGSANLSLSAEWVWAPPLLKRVNPIVVQCTYQVSTSSLATEQ